METRYGASLPHPLRLHKTGLARTFVVLAGLLTAAAILVGVAAAATVAATAFTGGGDFRGLAAVVWVVNLLKYIAQAGAGVLVALVTIRMTDDLNPNLAKPFPLAPTLARVAFACFIVYGVLGVFASVTAFTAMEFPAFLDPVGNLAITVGVLALLAVFWFNKKAMEDIRRRAGLPGGSDLSRAFMFVFALGIGMTMWDRIYKRTVAQLGPAGPVAARPTATQRPNAGPAAGPTSKTTVHGHPPVVSCPLCRNTVQVRGTPSADGRIAVVCGVCNARGHVPLA